MEIILIHVGVSIVFAVLIGIIINLYFKLKKVKGMFENYTAEYIQMMQNVSTSSAELYEYMQKIDKGGSFQEDDEVGFTFKRLKILIETYNNNVQLLQSLYNDNNK